MKDRVKIFDTTLRDGEQAPGIALNPDQKVRIAHHLAKVGVDVVEAGFPVSSAGDFEAVQRIAREVSGPTIAAMARTSSDDITTTWDAIKDAEKARIHLFLATSPIHMEFKLRMTPEEILTSVKSSVTMARDLTDDIEYTPEDATRSDPEFLLTVCQTALDAGATTLNIPDTVGYATPNDYGMLISRVVNEVKKQNDAVTVSTHCHNDLGLAVANSLAAVTAGARQVEVAVNGIGERAGNTSLEEAVMALTVRADAFSVETGVDTRELYGISQLVSTETGYPIQFNKAIVGRNAFAHESGIHQHGVLRNRATYEIMDPKSVGHKGKNIVMGKHSGRAAFKHTLAAMELDLDPALFEKAFTQLKAIADRQGEVDEAQMKWIVTNVKSDVETFEGVAESFR